jgi:CTP:molybdopterin cytidylyltransferase MocA
VPLIRRTLIALSGAGLDELVVVLGEHAEHLEPAVQDFPVTLVRNPSPQDGQVSSLRLGLAALSPKIDAVMVALADQPLLGAQDLNDLIGAYKKRPEGTQVVVPTVDGLPGNPVLFSAEVKEAVLAGDARLGCKQWQAANPEAVYAWATANKRYRQDVDSPEDIAQLAAQTGHQLRWPPAWQGVAP